MSASMRDLIRVVEAQNPVVLAVSALKAEAIARAEKEAQALVDRITKALENAGWDVDVAAPRGNSRRDSREQYIQKNAIHDMYMRLCTSVAATSKMSEPHIVRLVPAKIEQFIAQAREDAAVQYDAFVQKLVQKVGEVTNATLRGSHVWGFSLLTVTKPDGANEVWKTTQIVNVSKLGRLFNQWPTRKLKTR